jgi:hypothetical protein
MQQRDYIERLIQQIATFLARVVGASTTGDTEEAERALESAWGALGLRWRDAKRLDDTTLRMLLGAKAAIGADIFDAEASFEETRSNSAIADELRNRAAALR